MLNANASSGKSLFMAKVLSVILGALLTPVAMGLSLQLFPIVPSLLIFALIAGFFAYRYPKQNWKWGLWPAGGMVLAFVVVLLIGSGFILWSGENVDLQAGWGMTKATLGFGIAPGVVGGCLGGTMGSFLSKKES